MISSIYQGYQAYIKDIKYISRISSKYQGYQVYIPSIYQVYISIYEKTNKEDRMKIDNEREEKKKRKRR